MTLILSGTDGLSDVDGSASTPAIRGTDANTGIFFPAADTIAFAEGGAEAMRIDSSGNVLVGTTTATNNLRLNAKLGVVSTGSGNLGGMSITSYSGTTAGDSSFFDFQRSRGTTDGSLTIVANNDVLGYLIFRGSNGTGFSDAAYITASVDGTPGASNDMPGRLTFSTSADGSATPTERMRIDSSGNLLVGTTSAANNLYLNQSLAVVKAGSGVFPGIGVTAYSGTTDPGTAGYISFSRSRGTTDGSFTIVASGDTLGYMVFRGSNGTGFTDAAYIFAQVDGTPGASNDMPGRLIFSTSNDGSGGPTEKMRIDSSGNVGIGTSSPAGRLDVRSTYVSDTTVQVRFGDNTGGFLDFGGTAGATKWINASDGSSTAYPMAFQTGGTERARITSGGYFKASNSGTYQDAGSYHELRSNTSGNYIAYIQNTSANPYGVVIEYSGATPNGTSNRFLYCGDATAMRAEFRSNGGLANYSANDVNLSDRREKTNFAPAKNYLDIICSIPVQTFNYIDQSEDDFGLTLGVVAQDVQAIAPEFVMESDWSKEKDGSKMRLSIYQTDLQYALMKCIQELKAELDTVKAQNAAFEARLAALEAK